MRQFSAPGFGLVGALVLLLLASGEMRTEPAPAIFDPGSRALALLHESEAPAAAQDGLDFVMFRAVVEPILIRDRGGYGPGVSACVTCHVQSGTPMKLQPLNEDGNGGVYWTEEQSRMNYEVVSGLVTPGDPQTSRLLREPLAVEAGGARYHVGGKFWFSQDHPDWRAIAEWVETGSAGGASMAQAPTPDFEFFQSCVQRIFLDREEGQNRMECAACHGGGIRGFAQELPEDRDYWNEEESRANYGVVMEFVEPGYPLRSRFLTHPLDYHVGGDNYHSGGRRWYSQDDPEWQMLAAWVRGETPACVVTDR